MQSKILEKSFFKGPLLFLRLILRLKQWMKNKNQPIVTEELRKALDNPKKRYMIVRAVRKRRQDEKNN